MFPTLAVLAASMFGVAFPSAAQQAPTSLLDGLTDTDDVSLTGGGDIVVGLGKLEGRIISVDEDEVTLAILGRPDSRATMPLDNVPNAALFAYFERRADMSDAGAVRELAERAGHFDLHFHRADVLAHLAELRPERADEIEQERDAAIAAGAAARLERARDLREAGEYSRAVRAFREAAACGDVPAAHEARELLASLEADDAARDQADAERRRRREAASGDEKLDAIFAMADAADATLSEARRKLDELEDAEELLLGAEDTLDTALAGLDELAGEEPSDIHDGLRTRLEETLVDVHVELGYTYVSLGDAQSARRHAGFALSLAPNSEVVRELRAAIASSDAFEGIGD